jgi:molybdopterin converting factor small subunit
MAKSIRDILEGVKVKSPDEQRFVDKHTVNVSKLSPSTEDKNWDTLNGRSVKTDPRERHGYKNEEDSARVYEEVEHVQEREMTSAEMSKEKHLKKKYDSSSMKKSMMKQYGAEKGKSIYFATIRKKAMEQVEVELNDGTVVEIDEELYSILDSIHESIADENKENFYSMFEDVTSFEHLVELAEQVEIEE